MSNMWNTVSINNIIQGLSKETESAPWVRKVMTLELEHDILALSCAWHRVRNREGYAHDVRSLTDNRLLSYLEPQDHEHAEQIRNYYSQRGTMWGLHGKHLTDFRKRMLEFVAGDGRRLPEDWVGIAYRLPEFHQYDTGLDRLQEQFFTNDLAARQSGHRHVQVTFRGKLARRNRNSRAYDYWFEVADERRGLMLRVAHDNPLMAFWDHYLAMFPRVTLQGKVDYAEQVGFGHYTMSKYTISG
jgi:hypothetical protein